MKDIPLKPGAGRNPSPPGIPAQIRQARKAQAFDSHVCERAVDAQIRQARKAQGLAWYALAKRSGIPNQATIRDIEQGQDVKLSNLKPSPLGLELELIEVVT